MFSNTLSKIDARELLSKIKYSFSNVDTVFNFTTTSKNDIAKNDIDKISNKRKTDKQTPLTIIIKIKQVLVSGIFIENR